MNYGYGKIQKFQVWPIFEPNAESGIIESKEINEKLKKKRIIDMIRKFLEKVRKGVTDFTRGFIIFVGASYWGVTNWFGGKNNVQPMPKPTPVVASKNNITEAKPDVSLALLRRALEVPSMAEEEEIIPDWENELTDEDSPGLNAPNEAVDLDPSVQVDSLEAILSELESKKT
uniref:Uncharacterized protein n=1 Tax=Corydalis conspersa TaxID=2182691 RepID=A0A6G8J420_9MAGN|nr:hypothetical protein [Corydalis conspersa]QIM61599.1 hypothetical protein [Corydalis conspersa]